MRDHEGRDVAHRRGIVTLIYDKRTKGYSESGLGERSYELLAQDALAAVGTLRAHPEVDHAVRGEEPEPSVGGPAPEQTRPSRPITPLAWWETGWVQLGAMVLLSLAFASNLAVAFAAAIARRGWGRPYEALEATTLRMRRWTLCLATAGLATLLGFICYFGLLVMTAASVVGPVVAGRPIPWLALQALSVATCAFTALLAASWRSSPKALAGADRVWTGVLLAGGTVFAAWAAYWGLLSP